MLETGEDHSGLTPLVLCRSRGGPHEDKAFMSGWRMGELAAVLSQPGVRAIAQAIRPDERLQADLLAMARGYTMAVDPSSSARWLSVTFTRVEDDG